MESSSTLFGNIQKVNSSFELSINDTFQRKDDSFSGLESTNEFDVKNFFSTDITTYEDEQQPHSISFYDSIACTQASNYAKNDTLQQSNSYSKTQESLGSTTGGAGVRRSSRIRRPDSQSTMIDFFSKEDDEETYIPNGPTTSKRHRKNGKKQTSAAALSHNPLEHHQPPTSFAESSYSGWSNLVGNSDMSLFDNEALSQPYNHQQSNGIDMQLFEMEMLCNGGGARNRESPVLKGKGLSMDTFSNMDMQTFVTAHQNQNLHLASGPQGLNDHHDLSTNWSAHHHHDVISNEYGSGNLLFDDFLVGGGQFPLGSGNIRGGFYKEVDNRGIGGGNGLQIRTDDVGSFSHGISPSLINSGYPSPVSPTKLLPMQYGAPFMGSQTPMTMFSSQLMHDGDFQYNAPHGKQKGGRGQRYPPYVYPGKNKVYVGIGVLVKENDELKKQIAQAKSARETEERESIAMMDTLNDLIMKMKNNHP